ncbi:hypothetical protein JCM1840_003313 [Sporobolomyces johnsonii]
MDVVTSTSSSAAEPSKKRANLIVPSPSPVASSSVSPSPKKRVRRGSSPETGTDPAQDEGKPVTEAIERMLASDTESRSFGRLTIGQEHKSIGRGDVVTVHEPGWLVVVDDIRALDSDLSPIVDDATCKPELTESDESWTDHTWLNQCKPMGPNEKVNTDHRQWFYKQALEVNGDPSSGPELVYIFDDAYPAASPSSSTSKRSPHPLSHYSTPTLAAISPSHYASPALSYASVPCGPATNLPSLRLPDFHFVVYPLRDAGDSETDKRRKGDGRRAVPYIRTAFSFEKQEKRAEDEDEDEEREQKTGKGKGRKRKGGEAVKKVWPLMFNLHSLSPSRPYDPRSPQYFSRASQRWYDVAELKAGRHYRPRDDETGTEESTNSGEAGATGTKKSGKGEETGKDKSGVSTSLAPKQTTMAAHGISPGSVNRYTDSLKSDELVAALQTLSQSSIVRGGANGLTGNAYLVTRALELVAILTPSASLPSASLPSASSSPSSTKAATDTAAESRALLKSVAKWEEEVDDRENRVREGKGLGKAWRERGRAPVRCRWVCPQSREII